MKKENKEINEFRYHVSEFIKEYFNNNCRTIISIDDDDENLEALVNKIDDNFNIKYIIEAFKNVGLYEQIGEDYCQENHEDIKYDILDEMTNEQIRTYLKEQCILSEIIDVYVEQLSEDEIYDIICCDGNKIENLFYNLVKNNPFMLLTYIEKQYNEDNNFKLAIDKITKNQKKSIFSKIFKGGKDK